MKSLMVSIAVGSCMLLSASTFAAAGQPGQSCEELIAAGTGSTPGNAGSASNTGSPFSPNGKAGTVYADTPDNPPSAHSSDKATSQYDVACSKQVP